MTEYSSKSYKSETRATYCPGCGHHGVVKSITTALERLQIPPHEVAVVSGIGCSSNIPHFMSVYGMHTLHGRILPNALGIKLANHKILTIGSGGDGDGFSIGAGHFVHACRRNLSLKYFVMNNSIYGLTTGQASPTTITGTVTKSTPKSYTLHEEPLDPIATALGAGASFVARGFTKDQKQLVDILVKAIEHKGFAFVDIISPCVTWQKVQTMDYYKEKTYNLEEAGHDPSDFSSAMVHASKLRDQKYALGVFYQEERLVYEEQEPTLAKEPLALQSLRRLAKDDKLLKQFF
ncbi:MAG: thiamine pyrophosphate-dependent enzyme [Candidatus Kariarchaeaceae archaeon]